ncbi:MAG: efflux RND transporter periplasmic adaptor subunit [Chloroflexi bacterium]|nr:efflux RND transporter periplasmic adaptor subunit [Chloroflexota bacterium]
MKNRKIVTVITAMGLSALVLSGCSSGISDNRTAAAAGQPVEVKRGDLSVIVSTDGNLSMPNQYSLKFGTQGQVIRVFVQEGDYVHEGALLAMQDPSLQIDAIKSALFSIQTAQNNITLGCSPDHLPYNYPDLSIARMADEAETDIAAAQSYFNQGDYQNAGYWLVMTYYDIQVCEDLISTRPNAAVLAGAKTNSLWTPDPNAGSSKPIQADYAAVISYLQGYEQKLVDASQEIKAGDHKKMGAALDALVQQVSDVGQQARSTISIHSRMIFEFADTYSSADFLQSSLRSVQDLKSYINSDGADPVEAAKRLYIGKLNLQVARDVLETQTLIFETGQGINWQTLQQYNLSLQSAEVNLYNAKQTIMQNAIIAPVDGAIVQVDAKVSTVTSAQNYSSTNAITLVDTSYVRFTGLVDEIDILKVTQGQPATIAVDAFPNKTFTGKVQFISPFGALSGSVVKFTVFIALDPTDVTLRGGLTSTATITAASAKNVLLVPVSMVLNMRGGSFVMVENAQTGKPERRKITIGVQNTEYVEAQSGLQEGDKVVAITDRNSVNAPTNTQGGGGFRALR